MRSVLINLVVAVFFVGYISASAPGQDETANANASNVDKEPAWDYTGKDTNPYVWADMGFKQCGGEQQSPIDISTAEAKDRNMDPLRFDEFTTTSSSIRMKNNGHTVLVEMTFVGGVKQQMYGGTLPGVYVFKQLHFHWGPNNTVGGSEHTIDGKRAPLEMHVVYVNEKYGTVSEAAKHPGGIAVLGILFKIAEASSHPLVGFIAGFGPELQKFDAPELAVKKPLAIQSILPHALNNYYTYKGSLTTPGCQEGVIWTVFEEHFKVSNRELEFFRNVEGKHGLLTSNFRPVQKTNGRTVSYVSPAQTAAQTSKGSPGGKSAGIFFIAFTGSLIALFAIVK